MKNSFKLFTLVLCIGIFSCSSSDDSGDNGGGGAVSKTHHGIVKAGYMEEWTRYINCLMHAMNKCIERSGTAAFGKQGMNELTMWQMIYGIVTMYQRVKEEGTIALVDEIQGRAVQQIYNNIKVQEELAKNNIMAFDELMNTLDGDYIEAILEEFKSPRNRQAPVWTRWKTSLAVARLVKKDWAIILRFAVIVKQSKKVSSLPLS